MRSPSLFVLGAIALTTTACGSDRSDPRPPTATAVASTASRTPAPDVGGVRVVEAAPGGEPAVVVTMPARVRGVPVRRCWVRGHEGRIGTGFRSGGIVLPGPTADTAACAVALWQAIRAAPGHALDPGTYRVSGNADGRQNQYVPDNPDWEPDDFRTVAISRDQLTRAASMLRRTVAFP
ncbi:hypothetical protein AB0L40_03940 [Patulibacter sp. NPDC049589]|uniref:hypothetical protein n=1 Tax=Patulibacter sp. NPDC049589 TaxID=3154731 RepID=UPI00341BD309